MKSVLKTCSVFACAAVLCRAQSPVPFAALETPIPETTAAPYALADFDADGDLDLYLAGSPFLLLNDGDGRFAPPAAPLAAAPTTAHAVADFDGDGRADVFVATTTSAVAASAGTLWTSAGGPAGFAPAALPAPPALAGQIGGGARPADVNGDGLPDLILLRSAPSPSFPPFITFAAAPCVFLNVGGAFVSAGTYGIPFLSHVPFVGHDADGDGDDDLVTGAGVVSPNLGGTFAPYVLPAGAGTATAQLGHPTALADLDGDGDLDATAGDGATVTAALFGPGGFALGPSIAVPPGSGYPYQRYFAADANGDGAAELYFLVQYADRLERFDLAGGALVSVSSEPAPTGPAPGVGAFAGDIDGDGRDDVVLTRYPNRPTVFGSTGRFAYAVRHGTGQNGLQLVDGALPTHPLAGGAAAADVDGDGDLDLVGTEVDGGVHRIAIAVNDGAGVFAWQTAPLAPIAPLGSAKIRVLAGDFDGDGDADLATIEGYASQFSPTGIDCFLRGIANAGGGAWTSPLAFTLGAALAGEAVHGAVVADFDQDGFDDVALTLAASATVGIARGSAGGLTAPTVVATLTAPRDLAAADLDGDGDLDLAVAASPCAVLTNVAGVFAAATPFGTAAAVRVTAPDADLDGDADLWLDANLWLRSAGGWTFAGAAATGAAPGGFGVTSFDFEGDGDVDSIVDSGLIHLALGPGSVATVVGPEVASATTLFVDVDGDGDRDLLSTPTVSGTSGTFLSPSAVPTLSLNRARQTTLDAPFRAGRATHVGLHGAPNGLYFLFAALGTTSLAAPPFGTIRLDPASTILVAGGALDATGYADAVGFLPASFSAFAGLEVDLQGVVDTVAGPRIANLRRAVVRNY